MCRICNTLRVISGGGGNDAFYIAALDESGYLIARAAYLERACFLAVFALEIYLSARHSGKSGGHIELRVMQYGLEPLGCKLNVLKL